MSYIYIIMLCAIPFVNPVVSHLQMIKTFQNIRNFEDCKILQFHLDAVVKWSLDKEQNVDIITFLLSHAKQTVHTSLVK